MLLLGVDEAGRGCVIGPLIIAGVLVDTEGQMKLLELGVRDSKLLSRSQREVIVPMIEEAALRICIQEVSPSDIDEVVMRGRRLHKLNRLEARRMATIVEKLRPDVAVVDAADVRPERFKQHILENLSSPLELVSEHNADRNYPIVSAASLIAKVDRDRKVARLKATYGDFGSGYMGDGKTKEFLLNLARTCKEYPDFIRCSWKPARLAKRLGKTKQIGLDEKVRC
ncbi:MAG: ribonuclease HII [Candidatus Bathyarchaeota archaeon]|nr:MAG: ribonuclease HII [Candidatus Bathyarchaeota archaeon]